MREGELGGPRDERGAQIRASRCRGDTHPRTPPLAEPSSITATISAKRRHAIAVISCDGVQEVVQSPGATADSVSPIGWTASATDCEALIW